MPWYHGLVPVQMPGSLVPGQWKKNTFLDHSEIQTKHRIFVVNLDFIANFPLPKIAAKCSRQKESTTHPPTPGMSLKAPQNPMGSNFTSPE